MPFNPIFLEFPVEAFGKQRAKRSAHGIAYIPKETKSFEAEIRWHWRASKNKMIPKCPTYVKIDCFLVKPKSTKKSVLVPITKPDLDNCAKSLLDALNKFAWMDDNQISRLEIKKRYAATPNISILIQPDFEE